MNTELMGGDVAGINLLNAYSNLNVCLQGSGKLLSLEN
jgi:hypothetical protein